MAKRAQIDAVRPILTDIDKGVTATETAIDAVVSGADKAADVLESGLEKAADVVPEALDKSVHVAADVAKHGVRAFRNPRTVAFVIIGASMAAGAGLGLLGYKLMKQRLEKQYEERLEIQIETMRKFYMRRNKMGEYATPRAAAETLLEKDAEEALDEYQGKVDPPKETPLKVVAEENSTEPTQTRYDKAMTNKGAQVEMRDHVVQIEETINRNIFVDGKPLVDDDWDAEAEEANRDPEHPYVISHDEFMENTFEHTQDTLTYYAGDDVLADSKDQMITEVEAIVGLDNLGRFGHGSRDPRIVYVRNERTEADYEVARSEGKFSEEVMGLRHSDDAPRLRRARWGDDE